MTTPDIATGVSLMLMFVFMKIPLGWGTMLMAHIAFDTPYVLFFGAAQAAADEPQHL